MGERLTVSFPAFLYEPDYSERVKGNSTKKKKKKSLDSRTKAIQKSN